jgi:hypothetical protein
MSSSARWTARWQRRSDAKGIAVTIASVVLLLALAPQPSVQEVALVRPIVLDARRLKQVDARLLRLVVMATLVSWLL